MQRETVHHFASAGADSSRGEQAAYAPPTAELICLACEISAYAPDGDVPLF